MSIIAELSKNSKKENDLAHLITLIDNKLAKIAQSTYESVAYGMRNKECWKANDLITYKDILIQKINGCGCFQGITTQQLSSKIKQLTS